jgi:hypothetical protein
MNLDSAIEELKSERGRLERAIDALVSSVEPTAVSSRSTMKPRRRRKPMSPAARKRISLAMKKRWAKSRR